MNRGAMAARPQADRRAPGRLVGNFHGPPHPLLRFDRLPIEAAKVESAGPRRARLAREPFLALVGDLRPELHRYCATLVGSAIDGEDVVQEALAKALYASSLQPELPALRPWLFRIAHNAAIDFLRRYGRRFVEPMADLPESALADAGPLPRWSAPRCRASSRFR